MESKTEPCVELVADIDSVTIRLEMRLGAGERNMTAREAGAWFGDVVQDARNILLQRLAQQVPSRLVRAGAGNWFQPGEPLPELTDMTWDTPAEEIPAEAVAAALAAPPPPERPKHAVEKTKQGKALLAILRKEPDNKLDIPTLKDRSHLSDYMVRKTMKALEAAGLAVRHWEGAGGRWGGKELFSVE